MRYTEARAIIESGFRHPKRKEAQQVINEHQRAVVEMLDAADKGEK